MYSPYKRASKDRKHLSQHFISKLIQAGGIWGSELPEKHGINGATFKNWIQQVNKVHISDPRVHSLAKEIGCPEGRIFE